MVGQDYKGKDRICLRRSCRVLSIMQIFDDVKFDYKDMDFNAKDDVVLDVIITTLISGVGMVLPGL